MGNIDHQTLHLNESYISKLQSWLTDLFSQPHFPFRFNTTYFIFHFSSCFVPSQIPSSDNVYTQALFSLCWQPGSADRPVPLAALMMCLLGAFPSPACSDKVPLIYFWLACVVLALWRSMKSFLQPARPALQQEQQSTPNVHSRAIKNTFSCWCRLRRGQWDETEMAGWTDKWDKRCTVLNGLWELGKAREGQHFEALLWPSPTVWMGWDVTSSVS